MEDKSKGNFEYSPISVDIVAQNIDEYIIPECQEACKALWGKNIFTRMCSNRSDGNYKYISIVKLSKENEILFRKLMQATPENYGYSEADNSFDITIYGEADGETARKLAQLTEPFFMQDVLEGCVSVQKFLDSNFGEPIETPNPKFRLEDVPKREDYDDEFMYILAMSSFQRQVPETIIQFVLDPSKMDKTVEEYLQEAGVEHLYDSERGVIYDSEFFRDAHFRYLEYLKLNGKDDKLRALMAEDELLDNEIQTAEQNLQKNGMDIGDGKNEK